MAVVLSAMAAAAGCAANSGRAGAGRLSPEQARQIGREEARKVEQEFGLLDDQPLAHYLDAIGRRLAVHAPHTDVAFTFHLVDSPEPNAFVSPGGYVYVTRGLLTLLNSEDELACVVAHEIGHVAARHPERQLAQATPLGLLTGLSAGATGLVSPVLTEVVSDVGAVASRLILAPYSVAEEREADRLGQQAAADAGWDPAAMSRMLHTLEREEAVRGGNPKRFSFLAAHPTTPERVADDTEYAKGLPRANQAPIKASAAAFLESLVGIPTDGRATDGVFKDTTFLHPRYDFAVRFPEKWSTHNTREHAAAAAPDGSAIVLLEVAAEGDDPLRGAQALEQALHWPIVEEVVPFRVGSLRAAQAHLQAESPDGPLSIDLAWIAHGGRVFQLTGETPLSRRKSMRATFDAVARSFRPLTAAQRRDVPENRLHLITAQAGESLVSLVVRAKSAWMLDMVAVANARPSITWLTQGDLIKVAIPERQGQKEQRDAGRRAHTPGGGL
jgi:predicted Zn-dependent protease